MSRKAGKKLVALSREYADTANGVLNNAMKDLEREMLKINREITVFYENLIKGFVVVDGKLKHTLLNSQRVRKSRARSNKMRDNFVQRIGASIVDGRNLVVGQLMDKNDEVYQLLGVDMHVSPITVKKLNELLLDGLSTHKANLTKWQEYYTTMMMKAVLSAKPLDSLREQLITSDGHVRFGSSLENQTYLQAAMDLVQQKTAMNLEEGKRLGLKHCWNVNPMDNRTKPICIGATTAGCIPMGDMESNYGFPPRWICRCEIQPINGKNTELCAGVNEAIAVGRTRAMGDLARQPKQKAFWLVGDTKVVPKDPVRAAGNKWYKTNQDRFDEWEQNPLPDYQYKEP